MEKKKPHFLLALSTIVLLLVLVVYSVKLDISIVPALTIAITWNLVVARICGYTWDEITTPVWDRLRGNVEIFLIILAIGMFVACMIYSGTIPTIIYYLITIVSPSLVIVLTFLINMIVSEIIGTCWGTAGTVGVIMIAIGQSLGVPLPMVVGAVASGSHVGQLCSPMADTSNVAASFAETDTMNMIKRLAHYTVPVIVIATVLYTILGFTTGAAGSSAEAVATIRAEISSVFNTNPLVILPMVLVFYMTFKKQPVLKTLVLSSLVALAFGVVFNHFNFGNGLSAVYSGFSLSGTAGLDADAFSSVFRNLVNRGGMMSMIGAALLVIIATMYGTILTEIKAIDVIADTLFSHVNGRIGLTISSIVTAGLVVALTSSSFLAGMMPRDLFLEKYEKAGMDSLDCVSSAVSASTQYLTCIPWCDTALFIASLGGVSTLASLPYNFFGWGCSVMAIVCAVLGIGYKNGKRMIALEEPHHAEEAK